MNAFVRKEVRNLLPGFALATTAALSWWLLPNRSEHLALRLIWIVPLIACPALVLMMCLESFGRELSAGTLTNLLSQPISRRRIWWTKSLLLLAAAGAVFAVWSVSLIFSRAGGVPVPERAIAVLASGWIALVLYSGALWSVLLLRHVGISFWFSLIVPAAIAMLIVHWAEKHSIEAGTKLTWALVIYAAVGFVAAWRLFLRLQDIQWTGGTIGIPKLFQRESARVTKASAPRPHRLQPLRALIGREFRLQESQLVIAGALALLHLAAIGVRRSVDLSEHEVILFILEHLWIFWLFLPLLVGCNAVAEERKLGTLESSLCVPVPARTQFRVKLAVTLSLGVLLGAAAPTLLETGRILPEFGLWESLKFLKWNGLASPWVSFGAFAVPVALLSGLAFYFSTLSRNTLQAFGPTLLAALLLVLGLRIAYWPETVLHVSPWRGAIIYIIGFPVLLTATVLLAAWNFRRVLVGWPVWRKNLLVFAACGLFIVCTTSATYHRFWELFTPERAHGRPQLDTATMGKDQWRWIPVLLEDGRLWLSYWALEENTSGMKPSDFRFSPGKFLRGSNWSSVAVSRADILAVADDGTLWISSYSGQKEPRQKDSSWLDQAYELKQFGTDSDWRMVSSLAGRGPLLLKTNGTLWRLGPMDRRDEWVGFHNLKPKQIGTNHVWADIFAFGFNYFGLRTVDGKVFTNLPNEGAESLDLGDHLVLRRTVALDNRHWRTLSGYVYAGSGIPALVGINAQGQVQTFATLKWRKRTQPVMESENTVFDLGSDWVDCTEVYLRNGSSQIALRADGTLWQLRFRSLQNPTMKRLGRSSDWIAMTSLGQGLITLAADGSLWLWDLAPDDIHAPAIRNVPLLAPSRRPKLVANIPP